MGAPQIDIQVLETKQETTSGTEETTGFTAIPVFNAGPIVLPDIGMRPVDRLSGSLDPDEEAPEQSTYGFGFSVYFDGRTPTNAPPAWMVEWLPICGLIQTTRGGGSAPTKPTLAEVSPSVTGSGLTGTYNYKVTKLNLETMAETEASAAADSAATPSDEKVRITFANAGAGYATIVYRTKAGGSTYYRTDGYVLGTGAGGNLTWDDEMADTALDTFSPAPTSTAVVCWVPLSDNIPSATLRGYLDGHIRRNGVGSRGRFSYGGPSGGRCDGRFEVSGRFGTDVLNPTMPVVPSFSGQPPRIKNSALTLVPRIGVTSATGGSNGLGAPIENLCFSELSVALGTMIAPHLCGNEDDGIKEYSAQGRYQPRFTLTIDAFKGSSQWDPVKDQKTGTCRFGSSFVVGSGAGALKTVFPSLQISRADPVTHSTKIAGYALNMIPQSIIPNGWIRIERATS